MIFAVFLSVMIVFLLMIGAINLGMSTYLRRQASEMTQLIEQNGGAIPSTKDFTQTFSATNLGKYISIDDETAFRTRYFIVTLDASGEVTECNLDHIALIDEEEATALAEAVASGSLTTGYKNQYYYRVTENDDTTDIVFLDCTQNLESLKTTLMITGIISLALTVIVTVLFSVLSGRILKPFEENNKRQKRFITDASHELKTPLAIISANADVLKFKDGENQWLNNITDQTNHMSELIGDLLSLTKADEIGTDFVKEELDLIPLLNGQWENFRGPAEEKHVTMTAEEPDSVTLHGNREMLTRLFSVLFENAAKYVSENGRMELHVKQASKTVTVKVFNTAELPADFDVSHLFERFYRPDASRTSSAGGHGIGLSIAQKITENHKGKIFAKKEADGLGFTVVLPKHLK